MGHQPFLTDGDSFIVSFKIQWLYRGCCELLNGQNLHGLKGKSPTSVWIKFQVFFTSEVCTFSSVQFSSVQFRCSVVSDYLRRHESQLAKSPCPSQTPGVYSNSCPSSQWCHPAISSSVIPFSSYHQTLPASGSFPMSQLFASGGQSIGVSASASVLPVNIQDWFPLGWTG